MQYKVYTLNAFAKTPEGGNPAGVVLDADDLSEETMLAIAKQVGFSETAFVSKSDKADFRVRFFTPTSEVDLCGHATIGTFYLLGHLGVIKPGMYAQETKAGVLNLEMLKDGTIFMNQNLPQYFEKPDVNEIAQSLGIQTSDFISGLPIQIVSTGLKDILVPVLDIKTLFAINPDFDAVAQVSKKHDVIGYHLFTLETKYGGTSHCRNLAPLYDIPEEAATGTSNGALSCYLLRNGRITPEQASSLVFEQGYSMGKPSEILARLGVDGDTITEVRVGGKATNIAERLIRL